MIRRLRFLAQTLLVAAVSSRLPAAAAETAPRTSVALPTLASTKLPEPFLTAYGPLFDTLLALAKHLREKNGAFYPVGATADASGKIRLAAAYDGDEHPPSQQVIDMLVAGFASQARTKAIRASAIASDITSTDTVTGRKSDAIAVSCNGEGLEGVTIVSKYRASGTTIAFFDDPFVTSNRFKIFPADDEP